MGHVVGGVTWNGVREPGIILYENVVLMLHGMWRGMLYGLGHRAPGIIRCGVFYAIEYYMIYDMGYGALYGTRYGVLWGMGYWALHGMLLGALNTGYQVLYGMGYHMVLSII